MSSFAGLVGGILNPLAPAAKVAGDLYGAKEARKASERAEKRAFLLEKERIAGAPDDVRPGWISPPVFLLGGAGLLLVVFLLARRR